MAIVRLRHGYIISMAEITCKTKDWKFTHLPNQLTSKMIINRILEQASITIGYKTRSV